MEKILKFFKFVKNIKLLDYFKNHFLQLQKSSNFQNFLEFIVSTDANVNNNIEINVEMIFSYLRG